MGKKSLILLVTALMLTGCQGRQKSKELTQYNAQYLEYFDTVTSVTIYAENEEQFEKYRTVIEDGMEYYHKLFDIYYNYDGVVNVKSINDNAGIAPVIVDQELFDLLQFSLEEYERTGGMVNIAMGSVLSIWHEYREMGIENPDGSQVPDPYMLEKADEYTDIYAMELDEEKLQVYLPDRHMSLDVGAVAKGYATHKVAQSLRDMGAVSVLLSVGGNVETIGSKGDGSPWRIGIQNPDTSSSRSYLHVMELKDQALVTSGVYQRFYEVDGVRYHHIIHPDLLMPWNEYESVTILAEDGGLADAYSTAVFNMELEEGKAFIEAQDGIEAMWVLEDGTEEFSSGFRDHMSE